MGHDLLSEEEDCCPNCGHQTNEDDVCQNCGAVLKHDDEFSGFQDDEGSLDDDY